MAENLGMAMDGLWFMMVTVGAGPTIFQYLATPLNPSAESQLLLLKPA